MSEKHEQLDLPFKKRTPEVEKLSNQEVVNKVNNKINELLDDPNNLRDVYRNIKSLSDKDRELSPKNITEEIIRPIFAELGIDISKFNIKEFEYRYKDVSIERIEIELRRLMRKEGVSGQKKISDINRTGSAKRKPWTHAEASADENYELDPPRGFDPSKDKKI